MKSLIILAISILSIISLFGQDESDLNLIRKPFQITVMFPPISTNVGNGNNIVNETSVNTFIGVNGATDGFEVGGFFNINKYYMFGCQIGGFMNMVGSEGNIESNGCQIAGFANLNNKFKGVNIAGFMNVSGRMEGFQLAGLGNFSDSVKAATQISGFGNFAGKGETEVQLSGFINKAENVNGMQCAGFINIAKNVKGIQLAGFINICDTIDGIPIGFISIVKKGMYRKFEISASDFSYLQFSFKLGVKKFYNIYFRKTP